MEWLASGLRRDICILLYGEQRRAQQLKSDVESQYGRRLPPDRFYGAISQLESSGYLEKRVDGLHDVCLLTEAGREAVETHYEWMTERVASPDERASE